MKHSRAKCIETSEKDDYHETHGNIESELLFPFNLHVTSISIFDFYLGQTHLSDNAHIYSFSYEFPYGDIFHFTEKSVLKT